LFGRNAKKRVTVNALIPIFRPFYQETGPAIHVRNVVQTLADAGWQVDVLLYSEEGDVAFPGARTMALFSGHRWGPIDRLLFARGFFNLSFSSAQWACAGAEI
jgi:hypothetical protein